MNGRPAPKHAAPEREMLRQFLDAQRGEIVVKVGGLSRDRLIERHVDSKTTLLGLVKHLTDVERWWFSAVFAGAPDEPLYWNRDGVFDSDFDIEPGDDPEQIVARYLAECDRSRTIEAAAASLDDVAVMDGKDHTLRWIMVHMIEETARHAGHADILREQTDGKTGYFDE